MIAVEAVTRLAALIEQTPVAERDERLDAMFDQGKLTICSDNDISGLAKPVYQGQGFDLYLVDASNACASLTNDPDKACGAVLALHDEDED